MKREKEPEEMKRVARAECSVEEMAQEEMKIVEKHRVRWADMEEDLEMERVVTVEEREEQMETVRCGELEMVEERKWEGKAVQDVEVAAMKVEEREWEDKAVLDGEMAEMKAEKREWEGKGVQERELAVMKAVQDRALAAMEEREYGRHLEENQVAQDGELAAMKAVRDGELAAIQERERERQLEKNRGEVDDAEGGTKRERENRRKWDEVWASYVCLECGEEVFLGCKCGNGPPRVRVTREGVTSEKKEDGSEQQDDSDGWGDRKGRQGQLQVDVRRCNDWQSFETEYEEEGGRRGDEDMWNGKGKEEDESVTQGEGDRVCTRARQASWEAAEI